MGVGSSLFISGRNPPPLFEALEQPLDLTPQAVQGPSKWPRPLLLTFPGNGDAGSMTPPVLPTGPTALALIAAAPLGTPLGATGATTFDCASFPQGGQHGSLMPLAWGESPGSGLAIALGPAMDLGPEAALAAPSGCNLRVPFVAPAAG
jgi:hypothetical protein